jgi:hypothetical protein
MENALRANNQHNAFISHSNNPQKSTLAVGADDLLFRSDEECGNRIFIKLSDV